MTNFWGLGLKVEITIGVSIDLTASRELLQSRLGQDNLNHEPARLCL